MKNIILFIFFLVVSLWSISAQENLTYQYVRVPEKFDFLKHENQYEVNALTAFLFEKYGYKVLYKERTPAEVSSCDLLYADVVDDSGLFTTKLNLVLRNCADDVVFTSEEGKSREKDFKKAYHEALRKTFDSLEGAPVQTLETGRGSQIKGGEVDRTENSRTAETERSKDSIEEKVRSGELRLTNDGQDYRLVKSSGGFVLYRSGEEQKFASLIRSGTGEYYIYSSPGVNGTANFDEQGDLVVEYLDQNSGQLVTVEFQRNE